MDLIQFFGRFHVLVLHLPIGILLLAALIEVHIALFQKERAKLLNQVWFWGAISAIFACILGYMLSLGGGYNDDAVFIHKLFGISVAITAIICTLLFSYKKKVGKLATSLLVSLQLFLLFATGHYGANMTHGETYLVEHAPNFVRTLAGFEPHQAPRPPITQIEQADIYLDLIQPLFKANCISCHNDSKAKGKLNLANIEGINKGGKTAHTLGDGKLNNSELYKRITLDEHDKKFMPAEGKTPLTDTQVKTIAWWIKAGAPMTGNLQTIALSKQDKKILSQTLGLAPADNAWPLTKQTKIPGQVIAQLQQHGFLVKTIANNINYLDIDYSSNLKAISNEAISALVAAKDYVAYLNLINSQINLEQITKVAQLNNLLRLRLNKTPVKDEAIELLKALPNLEYLNLFGTQISDDSLHTLTQFPSLKQVYVGQTSVTKPTITEIAALKPELQIIALSNKLAEFQKSTQTALAEKAKKAAK
ncbi:c-type cytochrome domain-containing protein [Paraglaciecola sp.]|uniref:c-type cytochrome domain-containing protein n=1 Tax=Paraglaciecola sp. TaxID=1920173 RepID=UPI003EF887A2